MQSGQLCPWAHTCCSVPGCHETWGFPDGSVGKDPPAMQETGLIPGSRRFLGGRNGNPLQYFCPGKSHGQRSLAGYSPGARKESDTAEHTGTHTHTKKHSSELILVGVTRAGVVTWRMDPTPRSQAHPSKPASLILGTDRTSVEAAFSPCEVSAVTMPQR